MLPGKMNVIDALQITAPPALQFSPFSLGRLNVTLAKLIHISWAWFLKGIFSGSQANFLDLRIP